MAPFTLPVVSLTIYPVDCLKTPVKNWEVLRFLLSTCKLTSEPVTVSWKLAKDVIISGIR